MVNVYCCIFKDLDNLCAQKQTDLHMGSRKERNACFPDFFYSRSLKCPLHIASYALRIGVSVMELLGSEVFISYAF